MPANSTQITSDNIAIVLVDHQPGVAVPAGVTQARTHSAIVGARLGALAGVPGWLVAEEADFGMWLADFDPLWAAHPAAWHEAFPDGSLSQGRALLRQIHRLGLTGIGADAELDIVRPGTALAEFYRLSMAATAQARISAGLVTAAQAGRLTARLDEPDFLGCGFAFIGAGAPAPITRPRE